jgi:hypothetical protein
VTGGDIFCMKPCEKAKPVKRKVWGPVLVERNRRKQTDGVPMMEKINAAEKEKAPWAFER